MIQKKSLMLRIPTLLLLALLAIGASACKSKKKAMEASDPDAERARIEQEAARRADEERKRAEEEQARMEAMSRDREQALYSRVNQYFTSVANAQSPQAANNNINEALTLFSSENTPVLIVISEENGQKDYDRPTTIRNYLNYLKDQKKNPDQIANLQVDPSGKITEVELKKNY